MAEEKVIVHPTVDQAQLSPHAARAIFGMRRRIWTDGTPIKVFVLDDESPTHKNFIKEKLSIFPHQLRGAWDRLVFSGMGQAPRLVSSEDEMKNRVASTPGAIGYLPVDKIDDDVRVVDIK